MTNFRNQIPLSLLALLAALLLAACGEDGEGGTATSTNQRTAASQDTGTGPEPRRPEQGPDSAGERSQPSRGGEASIEDFGEEAAGAERAAILASFKAYLSAVAERDHDTACAHLASAVRRSLRRFVPGEGECPALLPRLLAPSAAAIAREQAGGEVTRVRVESERAFVVFKAPGAKLYQLPMVREGGEWRAGLLAASVLVPEL